MRHASRIQGSMAWGIYRENWNWLNSRELLYVPAMPADSEGLQEVRRADRSSGRVDRLPALNTYPRNDEIAYPFRFVSPDGKWVLRYYVSDSGTRDAEAVRIDGGAKLRWANTVDLDDAIWSRDSRSWVYKIVDKGQPIFVTVGLKKKGPFTYTSLAENTNARLGHQAASGGMLGFIGEGRILGATWHRDQEHALLWTADLNGREAVLSSREVSYSGAAVSEVELSPDGKQLGWKLKRRSWRGMKEGLGKMVPAVSANGATDYEFWLTDLKGESRRLVGSITHPLSGAPECFRFTPDGRSITFRFEGSLWYAPF